MKKLSGFVGAKIVQTGGDFAAPDVEIKERNIITSESSFEPEENEDQTDPNGESPHSGQFGVLTLQSDDFSARAPLVGFRTGTPEVLIDVQIEMADGNTITARKVRAKTMLDQVQSEKGQVSTWQLQCRTFVEGVIGFDA